MNKVRPLASLLSSIVVMVAFAAPANAADPGNQRPATCPSAHRRPILADAQVRIYDITKLENVRSHPDPEQVERYIACVAGRHHPLVVSEEGECSPEACGGIRHLTLTGVMLAYEEFSTGSISEPAWSLWVTVQNLRTGMVLHSVPTGTLTPPKQYDVGVGPAVAIVVKSDGAAAWIAENSNEKEGPPDYEVHAVDETGARLLAAGSNINPSSLAVAGDILYWTQGGKPYSVPLD
jgi:hypothetical protein